VRRYATGAATVYDRPAVVTPRTIRSADCRVMPWKNGHGSTTEIAVEPPGAALDGFEWRISVAELRGSGPFSTFPGYDRVILQLDGQPMSLAHGGAAPVRLEPLVPHAFSGDDETACAVDGVAHDFNLMVLRDVADAELAVHALSGGEGIERDGDAATVVYVLEGELELQDGDPLGAGDARVEGAGEGPLCRSPGPAVVLVASLRPRRD
jgi:environmental stress-induced protein Ves